MSDGEPKSPRGAKTIRGYSMPDAALEAEGPSDRAVVDDADDVAETIPVPPKRVADVNVPPADATPDVPHPGAGPAADLASYFPGPDSRRGAPKSGQRGTPLVEIEVIHEHGPAPSTERPWRTLEVWTRNRVYALDSRMLCIEVVDRGTRAVIAEHPFLGLRLVGGQHREGESIELSSPFPRPGTEAVFEQAEVKRGGTFSRTSAVTRVVLRLHIVTVAPNYVVPTWAEITHNFSGPFPNVAHDDDTEQDRA